MTNRAQIVLSGDVSVFDHASQMKHGRFLSRRKLLTAFLRKHIKPTHVLRSGITPSAPLFRRAA